METELTVNTTILNNDVTLSRFNNVFNNNNVYYSAARTKTDLKYVNMLLRILTFVPFNGNEMQICKHCKQEFTDIPLHILTTCESTKQHREVLTDCVAVYFPFQILTDMNSMCKEELLFAILGKRFNELLATDSELYKSFVLLNATYCNTTYKSYFNIEMLEN